MRNNKRATESSKIWLRNILRHVNVNTIIKVYVVKNIPQVPTAKENNQKDSL